MTKGFVYSDGFYADKCKKHGIPVAALVGGGYATYIN